MEAKTRRVYDVFEETDLGIQVLASHSAVVVAPQKPRCLQVRCRACAQLSMYTCLQLHYKTHR